MIYLKSFGIIPIQMRMGKLWVLLVRHVQGHYWGFPKGKATEGEVPHETAKRELFEETGLEVKELLSGRLFHEVYEFEKEGKHYCKEVVYFPALVLGDAVCAQPEEVEGFEWCLLENLEALLTYGPSKNIAQEFKTWVMEKHI